MDPIILILLGMLLFGAFIGLFGVLIFMALLIYNVKNLYPFIRTIALWAAKVENFLSFVALEAVLVFVMILVFVLLGNVFGLLAALLIVILLIPIGMLLGLGVLVYVIRIVWWLYVIWRKLITGWWTGLVPQLTKLQIKHDVGKDKDWKIKFDELRGKLSGEAERARDKISKIGK